MVSLVTLHLNLYCNYTFGNVAYAVDDGNAAYALTYLQQNMSFR